MIQLLQQRRVSETLVGVCEGFPPGSELPLTWVNDAIVLLVQWTPRQAPGLCHLNQGILLHSRFYIRISIGFTGAFPFSRPQQSKTELHHV